MIVLTDNDIILKLAWCDLFSEFLAVFEVSPGDVRILNTARHVLTSARIRKRVNDEGHSRLIAFLSIASDIDVEPDAEDVAALTEQPKIDLGEAVLFSICPMLTDTILVTGDKRSLRALQDASSTEAACARLCERLAGRVFCFEQIIERILTRFGFEAIRDRLIRGRECDQGLAFWLGSGLDANEASFREGLASYLNEVRQTSGSLLGT